MIDFREMIKCDNIVGATHPRVCLRFSVAMAVTSFFACTCGVARDVRGLLPIRAVATEAARGDPPPPPDIHAAAHTMDPVHSSRANVNTRI